MARLFKPNHRKLFTVWDDNNLPRTTMNYNHAYKTLCDQPHNRVMLVSMLYCTGKPRITMIYKNHNAHGYYKKFYNTGQVREYGFYYKNKRNGEFRLYDRHGNVLLNYFYSMGEKLALVDYGIDKDVITNEDRVWLHFKFDFPVIDN